MNRSERQRQIFELLQQGDVLQGKEIADRLGVSVSTVYRDIKALADSGVPIEGEQGCGFLLRPTNASPPIVLPALQLTSLELEALQLGLQFVRKSQDAVLAEAAERFEVRLGELLPEPLRQAWSEFYLESLEDAADEENEEDDEDSYDELSPKTLEKAIAERRRLKINYISMDDDHSKRVIRPLHLDHSKRRTRLIAWCELRRDFRVFRTDQIIGLTVGKAFQDEPGKTYQDFLSSGNLW